jgi:hypothetical protein
LNEKAKPGPATVSDAPSPPLESEASPAPPLESEASPAPPQAGGGQAQARHRLLVRATAGVVIALVLLAAGTYLWRSLTVARLKAEFDGERARSSSAQKQALSGQARQLLRLAARPLAWSIRAELLRDNRGQVDEYFREFVRERGVTALILVGEDGRIALASNRKLETQPAASFVAKSLLDAPEVAVVESGTTLRMAVPVMGFDRRLGTLVIDYDADGF